MWSASLFLTIDHAQTPRNLRSHTLIGTKMTRKVSPLKWLICSFFTFEFSRNIPTMSIRHRSLVPYYMADIRCLSVCLLPRFNCRANSRQLINAEKIARNDLLTNHQRLMRLRRLARRRQLLHLLAPFRSATNSKQQQYWRRSRKRTAVSRIRDQIPIRIQLLKQFCRSTKR